MYEDITQLREQFDAYKEELQLKLLKLEEQRAQTENGTLVLSYPPTRQDRKVILEVAGGASSKTVYAGGVNSNGTANGLPSGWTSTRLFAGIYEITHNLGVPNVALAQPNTVGTPAVIANCSVTNNSFSVQVIQGSSNIDSAVTFILAIK